MTAMTERGKDERKPRVEPDLLGFAKWIVREFYESDMYLDIDCGTFQAAAVALGVLVPCEAPCPIFESGACECDRDGDGFRPHPILRVPFNRKPPTTGVLMA